MLVTCLFVGTKPYLMWLYTDKFCENKGISYINPEKWQIQITLLCLGTKNSSGIHLKENDI